MNSARGKTLAFGFLALLLCLAVVTPGALQMSYRQRLFGVVPLGSAQGDYQKALASGRLGQGYLRPGRTFWRPFDFHGYVYMIAAQPVWDASEHLSGYQFETFISLRGHIFSF
jgi:hypothetical protein